MSLNLNTWQDLADNVNLVLCNNITNIDSNIFANLIWGDFSFDSSDANYKEFYQFYLFENLNLIKYHKLDVVVFYSELLDLYVLAVDHYGTSWDCVELEKLV